jgi:dihydroorotase
MVVGPGLVDLYSSSSEPGFESRESLEQLLRTALAGGFTRLNLLPNTNPPLDQPATLDWWRARLAGQPADLATLQVNFWGSLTQGLQGQQMTELAELAAAGVIGLSDGQPITDLGLLQGILAYVQPLQKPDALWPLHTKIAGHGVVRDGLNALRLGLPGIPVSAEAASLTAILELVAIHPTPVHIMRVSTARSVTLLQAAQSAGLPITASTTWHHLLFSTDDLEGYDPGLHLQPPLGNPEDRQALRQGICDGILQGIAVDHRAYTYEEKTVAFAEAPPGAIGFELALPLLWQQLVATNEWTALQLWSALSLQPARCLGQTPASLTVGQPAELMLFDPQCAWQVNSQTLKTPAQNTALWGQTVIGKVQVMNTP